MLAPRATQATVKQERVASERGEMNYMRVAMLASLWSAQLWYIVPLIVSVSLVYGATRHELARPILYHAWHTAVWMLVFMGSIFAVLWLVSWSV